MAKWLNPEGNRLSGSAESLTWIYPRLCRLCGQSRTRLRVCGKLLHFTTAEKYDSGSFSSVDHACCLLPLLVRAEPSRCGATSMLRKGVSVGNAALT